MSDHDQTLSALLDFAAGNPSPMGWHSIPLPSLGLTLLADSRAERTMTLLESVAGQHGRIASTGDKPDSRWIGCLIDPNESDLTKAADEIRESYLIAISADA